MSHTTHSYHIIKKALVIAAILVLGAAMVWAIRTIRPTPVQATDISFEQLIGDSEEGFPRADVPWRFQFPRDHGAHPEYQSESWYFTGHLLSKQGRRFGFQLSFLRWGLKPGKTERRSRWAANAIYRGHLAVTDVAMDRFYSSERVSREALGLSGAQTEPIRVWLEDWRMEILTTQDGSNLLHIQARDRDVQLDLELRKTKPVMTSGDRPPDNNGAPVGTFYSYSASRLGATGNVRIGAELFEVSGLAWLDRAWGLVPIPGGPVVWDRFLVQLDDGRELTGVTTRRRDGSGKPITRATLIDKQGVVRRYGPDNVSLQILAHGTPTKRAIRYPSRWRLRIPDLDITLNITPHVADQEIDHMLRYWGGAVGVTGKQGGEALAGNGFVELTGYANDSNN